MPWIPGRKRYIFSTGRSSKSTFLSSEGQNIDVQEIPLGTVAHKCHGKTFFLTAKLSFSRQNTLSHGKTLFLTAKHSFSRQLFHFTIKFHNFTNGKGRVVNMAAEEDRMDDFIQKDFFKGFTYREICMFLERNHDYVVSITTLKRKVKQLGLRRRMPCYNIDAIRRKNSRNVG